MIKNNEKLLGIVPAFCIFVTTQICFFWLVPDVECFLAVYAFVTLISLIHMLMTYLLSVTKGIRNSAGMIIMCSAIWVIDIVMSVILLYFDVSVKTAAFSQTIVFLVYLVVTITMYLSMGMDTIHIDLINATNESVELEKEKNSLDK